MFIHVICVRVMFVTWSCINTY